MSCIICLEEKNFLYNLCDICKNCLVCKSCMKNEDINKCDVCFNCRNPFLRVKRRFNSKDVLYFLYYFRYLIVHVLSMIVLPNLNMSIYFPEEKYLEKYPYLIQNQITFIVFMNYMNIVLFPYIFFCIELNKKYFWSISGIHTIFALIYPNVNKKGHMHLYLYYNLFILYIGCLFTLMLFIVVNYYNVIKNFFNLYIQEMKDMTTKIKICNAYVKKQRIIPLMEDRV